MKSERPKSINFIGADSSLVVNRKFYNQRKMKTEMSLSKNVKKY